MIAAVRPAVLLWFPVLVMLAATLWLWRGSAVSMVGVWMNSTTFNHAFLVPLISGWLLWRQRALLAPLPVAPVPWLLPVVAVACVGWIVGEMALVDALAHFALVSTLVLAVVTLQGLRRAREMAFPLAFLFFMVPIGEFTQPSMMGWTADFTVLALRASGVPVYREGLNFVIPSGYWSVVEACSGVRYLIASFMVGTLFAYLNYQSTWRRLAFMAISVIVPVVANWLRAYLIVMIGHLSNNQLAVGFDHLIYGWVFFGVVIGLMYLIGARWAEPTPGTPSLPAGGLGPVSAETSGRRAWLTLAGLLALVVASQVVVGRLPAPATTEAPTLTLPAPVAPWGVSTQRLPLASDFANANLTAVASYGQPGPQVWTSVAYFRGQSRQRKLVTSVHRVEGSGDSGWAKVSAARQRLAPDLPEAVVMTVQRRLSIGGLSTSLRLLRLYWVGGRWVAGDAAAKAWMAVDQLAGRPDDGAIVLLITPIERGATLLTQSAAEATADAVLAEFAQRHLGPLDAALRAARGATEKP